VNAPPDSAPAANVPAPEPPRPFPVVPTTNAFGVPLPAASDHHREQQEDYLWGV